MSKYFSLENVAAGLVTVLVGYTSSAVLIYQAALACGATPAQVGSWFLALGLGMGLGTIILSAWYRIPVIIAWSTPGAVMLIASAAHFSMPEIVGAFIVSGLLILLTGLSGVFDKIMRYLPSSLAQAMMAGMLLHFGLDLFAALQQQVVLVSLMVLVYFLGKQFAPRYAILLVLVAGILIARQEHLFHFSDVHAASLSPVWVWPAFSWQAMIALAIPLYIIAMSAQNIPGWTIVRAHGYDLPASPVLSFSGFLNVIFAPLGAFSLNLAAISAAACLGAESDADPALRYRSAIISGVINLIFAFLGATTVALLAIFPKDMVMALAGLALLGTLGNSLKDTIADDANREPALITFLVSASGFSLFGIGASLWGLLLGMLVMLLLRVKSQRLHI
ncbi:MAG: benzoate/H(+) symporter BenE family transporter [Legionellaceae bacterium]|nr:benzoate/H(+) symporter BenE family transporter [Legionellaceae bacterium]